MRSVLQSEVSECGLASLAMVANAHGKHLTLSQLRQRFPSSLKGAKLTHLVHIAQQLGFSTRPLRLDMEDLGKLKLPCILHWDLNHFVVLAKVGTTKVTIYDPAIGKRKLSLNEVSKYFTGIALELTTTTEFKQQKPPPSISARQLTGPIRGLWRALAQILLLSLALQVFVVLSPFYMQWVVDQVLVSADRDLLVVLGLGFGLVLLLQIAIGLFRSWSVIYLSSRLGLQWMGNVFAHLLKLPLEYFEKRHLGDLTSRMSSVQSIQKTLTTSFVEAIIDGLMTLVTLGLMLVYSWKLALVTLVAVVLYMVIRAVSYWPVRDCTEQQLVVGAKQQTHLLESLRGIQSLKVACEESLRRSTYENLLNDTVNQEVRLARMSLGFSTASQLVFGLERIAVIWYGATLALSNVFSVGMLIAYLSYKDQFASRISSLIDKWVEFRMLRLHGERLADIVLTPPEEDYELPEMQLPKKEPDIEVEGLSFRYGEDEPWVLKDCSFKVAAGESVAIIGASGCGKTTLMKLLLGLLKPTAGTIRISGRDLHKFGTRNVRSIVGAVMQDDQLFAGSVADNISFFDPDFDLERIEAAAKLAAIHEDIAAMPMGYHALIGDMGSALSGGQKQRVILARALYRQPKLLFLDEATSHLDVMRERLVNDAVHQLKLTKVIVAHRPETIASTDRVVILDHGRIVQTVAMPEDRDDSIQIVHNTIQST
ncbi:peptidase domain-containing ABC transporter [Xylella fastidiosa]|uniref:Peptidase domain-containing ABC transporter n=1 Tax=Xylella fastidiosa subsp. multiplex TaxID=644357 RepID=A0A9Q4QSS5_XYLFS|nr:peptidase domain-containing ABC transporter [Xylella fastidiosa]ERI60819.1 ABC transporter [Xylella fastidiosa subsp. multiplex Griffin-1]ACA11563.1 colicin V secretion ABC transporter ATP-binding protein [Xylella fastidiosa M12]KAJ4852292.1 peptidase domain-containing ABC transporter [Xylella fastidiosa subsp. multiplex]KFA41843.1 colicin V secretion ABC transporter ATP-binding protein [Xylella fastidiosa]MBE0268332.1 peptidase domain-containing ABC transporter [Xylella fastidiosa subsp. m